MGGFGILKTPSDGGKYSNSVSRDYFKIVSVHAKGGREGKVLKTKAEKLAEAVALLREVSENWDESKVKVYPSALPSFDEVVAELAAIEFDE